jgi:hypothetical protein
MSDVVTASIGSHSPGELDPLALGNELEVGGRCVQGTGLGLRDRELRLGVASENPLTESALSALIGQLDRIIAVRLDGNDGDGLPGNHASETQAGLEILKLRHGLVKGRPYRVRSDESTPGGKRHISLDDQTAASLPAWQPFAGGRRRHVAPTKASE